MKGRETNEYEQLKYKSQKIYETTSNAVTILRKKKDKMSDKSLPTTGEHLITTVIHATELLV